MADVHLVLQKANASDLVLPSKVLTILSVGGVAIVTANPNTSLFNMMNSTNMGFVVQPEKQSALNEAISLALQDDNQSKRINARRYAEDNLSINSILSQFSEEVFNYKLKPREIFERGLIQNRTFFYFAALIVLLFAAAVPLAFYLNYLNATPAEWLRSRTRRSPGGLCV